MRYQTKVLHPKPAELPAGNEPLLSPIYHSSKFKMDSYAELRAMMQGQRKGHLYSRITNPTVCQLETYLAELQGCEAGVAFGSGIGAVIGLVLNLVEKGDHVVGFRQAYKPTRLLVKNLLPRFGVRTTLLNMNDWPNLEKALREPRTKLILFESPTNPTLEVTDIQKITALCAEHGVLAILDNTFAGFHQHHNLGVDFYVHSLSKYACALGEGLGGVVTGRAADITRLRMPMAEMGSCLDAFVAARMLETMQTYALRYEQQTRNAGLLVEWLQKQAAVAKINYPGLKGSDAYAVAKKQMQDFGPLIYFELSPDTEKALEVFLDHLNLVAVTGSLGATKTLIAPCELFYAPNLTIAERQEIGIAASGLRLSVGLESTEDLKEDIAGALARLSDLS